MPQMSPLLWEILYLLIVVLMFVSFTKLYFLMSSKFEKKEFFSMKKINNNWLW